MTKKLTFVVVLSLILTTIFGVAGITTANAAETVPMLKALRQTAANQLEISYDIPCDVRKATTATNYWVMSVDSANPTNIATLGNNDKVTTNNSLTSRDVTIHAKDASGKVFTLTFNQNIKSGMKFKLITCFITVPGGAPYNGDNGIMEFVGR